MDPLDPGIAAIISCAASRLAESDVEIEDAREWLKAQRLPSDLRGSTWYVRGFQTSLKRVDEERWEAISWTVSRGHYETFVGSASHPREAFGALAADLLKALDPSGEAPS